MTAPTGDLRAQLADALPAHPEFDGTEIADMLLPVVESYGRACAATALRDTGRQGACFDLSPSINFGGDGDVERLRCELPHGHDGAHQADTGDGLTPTRWIRDDAAEATP